MYDLDHTINGMIISLVPMCVIVIIELGEHFRIIFVLNQRESWAGRERVDQLVGVRVVAIYIYILLAMASSEHPVISPSLLANIDTPKWVDPDLFDFG